MCLCVTLTCLEFCNCDLLQGLNDLGSMVDDAWGEPTSEPTVAAAAQLEQQQLELTQARTDLAAATARVDELQQQVCSQLLGVIGSHLCISVVQCTGSLVDYCCWAYCCHSCRLHT